MTITLYIVIIILISYFVWISYYTYNENIYVISDIDNNSYLIRRGRNKSKIFLKNSANMLAEINKRILSLIKRLEEKEKSDENKYYFIKYLKKNYNASKLSEAAYDPKYTTYTINKDEMHICLRTRDMNENLYDVNLLMYVILHELSHMCNYDKYGYPINGHGPEFKYIFHTMVTESIDMNLYKHRNYKESPAEYCGIMLTTSIV
jgi:hypothetical protein